eukprot:gnl/TRDRNA2_/TRDRNA2_168920_c2_seq1.p1 gnl/TRDRNA2_/TRDRNA2_168920_c2~~gnl/TRDRNA2_/TRDRNA2_168920_c2_seq1.p1  ORF type:complete len:706 (+),score=119.54 gnl/TRDRNA2_/TRDRNA2_168920_c2_seq1:264-2120(+)
MAHAYADAWHIVEERFGGADYLLLADHRSFVNVPALVHILVPVLPAKGLYLGCLIDETLYGVGGDGCGDAEAGSHCSTRRDYLWRRRAPMFAHGMGFLVSADLAKTVADFAKISTLKASHLPADVAFGVWLQAIEGTKYESAHLHFHLWPGSASGGDNERLEQPITDMSTVVFPMTVERWRHFDARTCTLSPRPVPRRARSMPALEVPPPQPHPAAGEAEAPVMGKPAVDPATQAIIGDCWDGMGGRPEAWYLVCCELHWMGCWGGGYTAENCCKSNQVPATQQAAALSAAGGAQTLLGAAAGLEALRRFLRFTPLELQLFLLDLGNSTDIAEDLPAVPEKEQRWRFRCLAPRDCAREAFARLYQRSWETGILPLRHPWLTDREDHLFGLYVQMRSDNNGWGPKGHEHTFERVQLANWLKLAAEHVPPKEVPGERRCLEWDSSSYSRHYFGSHCDKYDVVTYAHDGGGQARLEERGEGHRRYVVDIHEADAVIPPASAGVVVCVQIFEHLRKPHVAMAQLFKLMAPGGFIVWSAPLFSEIHGSPGDYFRYTPFGAKALAEDSGFAVLGQSAPGDLRQLAGYLVGMTAPYWPKEDLTKDVASNWPLQVYMLLQKPYPPY